MILHIRKLLINLIKAIAMPFKEQLIGTTCNYCIRYRYVLSNYQTFSLPMFNDVLTLIA